jgi:hypothetical protein
MKVQAKNLVSLSKSNFFIETKTWTIMNTCCKFDEDIKQTCIKIQHNLQLYMKILQIFYV